MGVGDSIFDSMMNSIFEKSKVGKGIQKLNKLLGDLEVTALEATKLTIDDEYKNTLLEMGHEKDIFEVVREGEEDIGHRVFRKKKDEESSDAEGESKEGDSSVANENTKDKRGYNKKSEHWNKKSEGLKKSKGSDEVGGAKSIKKIEKNRGEENKNNIEGVRKEVKNRSDNKKEAKVDLESNSNIEVSGSCEGDRIEKIENAQRWERLFDSIDSSHSLMDGYFKKRLENDEVFIKNLKELNEKEFASKNSMNEDLGDGGEIGAGLDTIGGKKPPKPKGGKGGKFLSRLVKGAGKIALPLTAAMALWDGVNAGSDDEAILERTGKSEISTGDRVKQGAAGALAGLVNWIPGLGDINASNTADLFEKSMNFLSGDGFSTDRELRESGVEEKSFVEKMVNASPIGMLFNAGKKLGDMALGDSNNSISVSGAETSKVLNNEGIVSKSVSGAETSKVLNKKVSSIEESTGISGMSNTPIVNNTYNTTNVTQETQPRFRITDESTRALSVLGS